MAKLGFLLAACFIVLSTYEVSALKCWRCSSDATSGAFCDDPFDASVISEQTRRYSYVDCVIAPGSGGPINPNARPVCKKLKQLVNDKVIVSRTCSSEDVSVPHDQCSRVTTPAYVKTEFCETCTTDGCNGASQFGAAVALVAVTALLTKLF